MLLKKNILIFFFTLFKTVVPLSFFICFKFSISQQFSLIKKCLEVLSKKTVKISHSIVFHKNLSNTNFSTVPFLCSSHNYSHVSFIYNRHKHTFSPAEVHFRKTYKNKKGKKNQNKKNQTQFFKQTLGKKSSVKMTNLRDTNLKMIVLQFNFLDDDSVPFSNV